jgi:hypothetical protein
MRRISLLAVALGFTLTAVYAAEEVKLDGIKCVVQGDKAAKADKSLDYKDGKIYFCCGNCPKAFEKDKAKFETKANAQLVATGQAKQGKCPLTGKDVDKSQELTLNGAKVNFCCGNCKGKVEKAKGDDQLALVFSDDAWKKAEFKVEKKK